MPNREHVRLLMSGDWNRLRKVHLVGDKPDFSDVNFVGKNLMLQNLEGADFRRADFSSANLESANLRNADFRESYIVSANIHQAELDGADFSNSKMGFNILTDLDLSNVIGLETVQHIGPSSLGIDTIYRSKGQIPDVFLRGCGINENFIPVMKSIEIQPVKYFSCFISYSHQDKSFARQLYDKLKEKAIRCWLDEHQLLPGDDLHEEIDRGIRLWDKVLLCCSEAAMNSWWVDKELDRAIKKEERLWKERGKKVLALIPLNLDNYLFDNWKSGKKDMVISRLAADFTGWETDNAKFEEQFERVVKALQTRGAREEAPTSKL